MAYLTINGIELEVTIGGGARMYEELDAEERALDGTLISTRTVVKKKWELDTIIMTRAEAEAWAGLLQGRGDTWKMFDATGGSNHGYSSKGYAPTTSGAVAFNTAQYAGLYGGKMVAMTAPAYARWTLTGDDSLIAGDANPKGDYTLIVWSLDGGTGVWTHRIIRNLDGVLTYYDDGVLIGAPATPWAVVDSSGYVQLGETGNDYNFADFTTLPFGVPAAWVPFIYAAMNPASGNRPWPKLPKLEASGEMLSNPTTPLTVKARGVKETPAPSSGDSTSKRLEFTMQGI